MYSAETNQTKASSFRKAFKTLLVVYLCGVTLAVIALVAWPSIMERMRYAITNDVRVFASYGSEMTAHSAQRSRPDTLVILGDSIARGLDGRQIYDGPSYNFGIGGDTIRGVAMRVATYDIEQTETMLLLVGVNDLARYSDQQILVDYRVLLESLKAKNVLVCAILPLNETVFHPANITKLNGKTVNNARIAEVNQQLGILCRSYRNVRFCDPRQLMVDSTGNCRAEFTRQNDGVHLNANGGAILQRYLKEELNKLNRD